MRGEDGCRHLRWERTEGDGAPVELPIESDPAAEIDVEAIRGETAVLLERVARKIGVEKRKTALLLYVTAMDVALTEDAVLGALGVGKSMAYRLKDKAMETLRREMRRTEGSDDPLFGRLLLETCEKEAGDVF